MIKVQPELFEMVMEYDGEVIAMGMDEEEGLYTKEDILLYIQGCEGENATRLLTLSRAEDQLVALEVSELIDTVQNIETGEIFYTALTAEV